MEKEWLLRSLSDVGPSKPVGYLPLYTIRDFVKADFNDLTQDAAARGLVAVQFGPAECCIKSGAFYVYHHDALAGLLSANSEVLLALRVPTEPALFVAYIAAVWLEDSHPACPIVAKAFGEVG